MDLFSGNLLRGFGNGFAAYLLADLFGIAVDRLASILQGTPFMKKETAFDLSLLVFTEVALNVFSVQLIQKVIPSIAADPTSFVMLQLGLLTSQARIFNDAKRLNTALGALVNVPPPPKTAVVSSPEH